MFKRFQISSLGIRVALLLTVPMSLGLDASDPCSARKFCGNLTVIYNGAGENLADNLDKKGIDPAATNTVLFLNNATKIKGKNNKVLLLSSDSTKAVAAAVASAETKLGENFNHIPTSKPSFEAYLKNDTALEQMKLSFSKDPACAQLMKDNPGVDISKFIKLEFMVSSHSYAPEGKFVGLPVWPNNTDRGEDEYHTELAIKDQGSANPKSFVQTKDFEQLRNTFSESVIQAAAMSCDAVDVADIIAPLDAGSCSCFVAYSDRGVVAVVDTNPGKTALSDAIANLSQNSSLLSFANPMQNYYRWTLMGSGPKGLDKSNPAPIFTIDTSKPNHFDLFALTSADVYAAEVVSTTPATVQTGAKVVPVIMSSDKELEVAYRETLALAERAETQNQAYLDTLGKRDPTSLKRSREAARDFFNTCVAKPDPKNRMCVAFQNLIDSAAIRGSQDPDFADVRTLYSQIKSDLSEMADSPIMEGKNDDPVANLAKYRKYWQNFADFRNALTRAARKLDRGDEVVAPMEQMSTKWATYHSAYIHAYFPDVMGDTLKRRVENYTKAANALKAKYVETNDPKYKKKLQRLRSQLACTLNFPIGPNYKESNEFPVGKLVVDNSNNNSQGVFEDHVENKEEKPNSSKLPALR